MCRTGVVGLFAAIGEAGVKGSVPIRWLSGGPHLRAGITPVGALLELCFIQSDRDPSFARPFRNTVGEVEFFDYRIIKGDTEDKNDKCYAQLAEMLDEKWGAQALQLERMLLDSGDGTVTATIYDVCRMYGGGDQALMIPLKGLAMTPRNRIYQKVVDLPGERFPLVEVYGDAYKNKLALWLKQDWRPDEEAPIGWPMFPTGEGYNRTYYKQLGNDERVKERRGAMTIIKWKSRGRIEAWDVLVYGSACEDFVLWDYSTAVLGLEKSTPHAVWEYFEALRGEGLTEAGE